MIVVHHLEKSRSHRVVWLLEELGLPYAIEPYRRDRATYRAPRELRAVHPLGKSPIVVDDGHVLTESAVVLERLLDRYGDHHLRPPAGSDERHNYDYWMHYAEGSLMPNLLLTLVLQKMPSGAPALLRPLVRAITKRTAAVVVAPEVKLHLDYVESELAKRPYLAGGAFSAADIQMSFPLRAARGRVGKLGAKTSAYLQTLEARPAFLRAAEKVGEE